MGYKIIFYNIWNGGGGYIVLGGAKYPRIIGMGVQKFLGLKGCQIS